jgi:aspartate/methionine/tyrosine aminotransferase
MVTHGLTQGVALTAELFADPDTDVVVASPYWGNYNLIFGLRPGARLLPWQTFKDGRLDLDAFAAALSEVRTKAIIVLNFPQNPTGYTPTLEEADAICEIVLHHPGPAVVLCDDAYAGMVYEPGLAERSLFWPLCERADADRLLVVKLDGSTKELLFFPGRVGFYTHSAAPEAQPALLSKLKALARSAVSGPPGPSQALVWAALQDERLEHSFAEAVAMLSERYAVLKQALESPHPALDPYPFNSGCFALVRVHGVPADTLRRHLIDRYSTGTVAIGDALRIAYCSTRAGDLPELVANIKSAADDLR